MITSRAPLRISLLGGGSDYQNFFQSRSGLVVGGAISKYVYVNIARLPQFSPERFRLTYRKTESVQNANEISHPVVREMLTNLNILDRLNISTMSDVSGSSGLGGSSAFTVALREALAMYQNIKLDAHKLAEYAIFLERSILQESGGWQDQYHCSVGGFRAYKFSGQKVEMTGQLIDSTFLQKLSSSCFLYSIGSARNSSLPASATNALSNDAQGQSLLMEVTEVAETFVRSLSAALNFDIFFEKLTTAINQTWMLKSKFGKEVAGDDIHEIINKGKRIGVRAAKLCGAGGSGFILFMAEPEVIPTIRQKMGSDKTIQFKFVEHGVQSWRLDQNSETWTK